jgi:hypothetical protein
VADDTRGVRNWHVYWNWQHILERKTLTGEGCPFSCSHVGKLPEYHADMCPKTKDIIMRLATFRISPTYDEKWADEFTGWINAKFKEVFGC